MQRLVNLASLNERDSLPKITLASNYTIQASCKHIAMLPGLVSGKKNVLQISVKRSKDYS